MTSSRQKSEQKAERRVNFWSTEELSTQNVYVVSELARTLKIGVDGKGETNLDV